MKNRMREYEKSFKVIWVDLEHNECSVLKGPSEEMRLIKILQNDYNSSRYDKWIQLIANEVVCKDDALFFLRNFSSESIRADLQKEDGRKSWYVRLVNGEERRVKATVWLEKGTRRRPKEVMIYVEAQGLASDEVQAQEMNGT